MVDPVPGYRLADDVLEQDGLVIRHRAFERDQRGFERESIVSLLRSLPLEGEPRARFERDAEAAMALRGERIDTPEAAGFSASGRPCLVSPARRGKRLTALLEDGPLSAPLTLRIGLDLAQALEVAHAAGVPHGALRPSAVWIDERGFARLADFGFGGTIATIASEQSALLEAWCRFHSPEQVRGAGPTTAGDRFALASLLYELMTGEHAFGAPTALAITLKISMAKPPPLDGIAGLSRSGRAVLERLFAREPSERPSATELARALADAQGREADDRRALAAQVAPPRASGDGGGEFRAFDELPDDPTSLQVQIPNHVPSDVSIPLASVSLPVGVSPSPDRGGASPSIDSHTRPMSLDDLTEPLRGRDPDDAVTENHTAPPSDAPATQLIVAPPEQPDADPVAQWGDSTLRLVQDAPPPLPDRFAPSATFPARAQADPGPGPRPESRSTAPHPALLWLGISAGAVLVVLLVAMFTVWIAR